MIDHKIAELIGAHCGDGTLYRTTRGLVWELRGALDEKGYYFHNICPLLNDLFSLEVVSKFRSGGGNGCWGVQTSNKEITSFFLNHGFTPGTKTYTVSVPDYILEADVTIKRAFVRGLFDTDGCLYVENKRGKPYPRIEIRTTSKVLCIEGTPRWVKIIVG